jgi:hypothetical protein
MIPKRHLAEVIWIAIVTIAIQLLPATALAHGGHVHARDTIAAVANDAADNAIQLNSPRAAAEHTGTFAQAVSADITRTAALGTCNGDCCASGFSCCVPAILPQPALHLPTRLNALEVARPGTSIRADIDPETLPKPPRSFA